MAKYELHVGCGPGWRPVVPGEPPDPVRHEIETFDDEDVAIERAVEIKAAGDQRRWFVRLDRDGRELLNDDNLARLIADWKAGRIKPRETYFTENL